VRGKKRLAFSRDPHPSLPRKRGRVREGAHRLTVSVVIFLKALVAHGLVLPLELR